MIAVCTELIDLLNMPPSDMEPGECYINKLRRMSTEEREKQLSALNFIEQLKIARTHKVCLMLNRNHSCILNG